MAAATPQKVDLYMPKFSLRWDALLNDPLQSLGMRLAFQGDVVRFLRSVPDSGQIFVQVYAGKSPPHESTFKFAGLDPVRRLIGAACPFGQPGLPERQPVAMSAFPDRTLLNHVASSRRNRRP